MVATRRAKRAASSASRGPAAFLPFSLQYGLQPFLKVFIADGVNKVSLVLGTELAKSSSASSACSSTAASRRTSRDGIKRCGVRGDPVADIRGAELPAGVWVPEHGQHHFQLPQPVEAGVNRCACTSCSGPSRASCRWSRSRVTRRGRDAPRRRRRRRSSSRVRRRRRNANRRASPRIAARAPSPAWPPRRANTPCSASGPQLPISRWSGVRRHPGPARVAAGLIADDDRLFYSGAGAAHSDPVFASAFGGICVGQVTKNLGIAKGSHRWRLGAYGFGAGCPGGQVAGTGTLLAGLVVSCVWAHSTHPPAKPKSKRQ